jgi:hypothetical protein
MFIIPANTKMKRSLSFSEARTYPSPKYSPIIDLLRPSVLIKNPAISWGEELVMKPVSSKN